MEYQFHIPGLEVAGITVWDAGALVQLGSVEFHKLRNLLEDFGQRSAVAQGLRAPITDIWRLRSSDQRLYLHTAAAPAGCCVVLGGLKVGKKKLFMHRANGAIVEVEPLCVLDFYVHESHQRQGVGKALFECMLDAEQLGPELLGYDRPSSKLLAFLRKHYGLASYVPQPNNFVVFEQYFEHMPGSPGRGKGGSTNSSASWGPGALASLGHGRQTLHIIGSRAAEVTGVDPGAPEQWMRSSLRPPTPSQQHCVQLHTAHAGSGGGSSSMSLGGSSLGGSSACSTTTSLGGAAAAAWSPLGGPGCPTAGSPTKKGEWDAPVSPTAASMRACQGDAFSSQQQQYQQQVQQVQPPVHYGRGTGMKALLQGRDAAPYSHAGHQQALLAAAANPAPPRIKAGPLPPTQQLATSWQQQQQQQQTYGSTGGSSCSGGGQDSLRDSLDRFVGGVAGCMQQGHSGAAGAGGGVHQSSSGGYGGISSIGGSYQPGSSIGSYGSNMRRDVQSTPRQQYAVTAPFASWEPQPGSLLPQECGEGERVSLRRQAAQLAADRMLQKQPAWVTAGAGPPGHLLAAPQSTYAVATADMAKVVGREQQQQYGGYSSSGRSSRHVHAGSAVMLSWDGLPQGMLAAGQAAAGFGGSGGGNGGGQWSSNPMSEHRAAAATHRSGSGAASCMRFV